MVTPAAHTGLRPPRPIHRIPRWGLHTLWMVALAALCAVVWWRLGMPALRQAGSPWRQGAAMAGVLLLFVPLVFSVVKRAGLSTRPPTWFVAHALASTAGLLLVLLHASGGRLLSVPGALLALLGVLVLQGCLARLFLSAGYARQFGTRSASFHQATGVDRSRLAEVIALKRALLTRLDPDADEAVFSPTLRHALRHPRLSWRYAQLAARESALVGARARAGGLLSRWRRLHMALAAVFLVGVLAHVVVVTWFAGYAAGGRAVYWWHLAAWGA